MCGEETDYDDGFVCRRCGAYWSTRGLDIDEGEWVHPEDPQCRKILRHGRYPILSGRCILTDGHEPDHWNGNTSWRNGGEWRTSSETTEAEVVDLVKR